MGNLRFPTRDAAARFLRNCGFVFMGAPDRWSLHDHEGVTHADISEQNGAWYVRYRRSRRA